MPGLRRRLRFHGLKRAKIRQDMNKYNLYNISRMTVPFSASRTYFQQKWTAKAQTRAYHGEQIKEKQWQQMFSRVTNAVVPMNPDFLASNDGSAQAAGRGSGLEIEEGANYGFKAPPKRSPYMQMVYAPTERRLDTAIFRALFASSARQARQFVTHGQVKVNGKKMLYPGYLLNPGDLFQVEPERVLYATGAFKNASGGSSFGSDSSADIDTEASESADAEADAAESALADAESSAADLDAEFSAHPEEDVMDDAPAAVKTTLKSLRIRAKALLTDDAKKTLSGKRLQELRAFARSIRSTLSRASSATPSTIDELESQLASLTLRISGTSSAPTDAEAAVTSDTASESPEMTAAIARVTENPYDPSKPYATPWRPREWMSAFALIPRYLEVNQKICAAVYLRHPVVKPGLGEVPTPFNAETGQLAFNWYLRRR